MSTQINTADMQVNQIAKLMDEITIVKLNESEFILARKGDKLKKGKLPFDTDVTLLNKSDLEQAVLEANHQGDWMSMMYSELIRTKVLPEIN